MNGNEGATNNESISAEEEVTRRLNREFEKMFHRDTYGCFHPNVCSICDIFLKTTNDVQAVTFDLLQKTWHLLTVDSSENLPEQLSEYYQVNGSMYNNVIPWNEMYLSKQTRFVTPDDARRKCGIASCSDCMKSLLGGEKPKHAISNGFYFGYPPKCLTELSEVEMAFLTPVKTHGFCFSYSGGFQKELKGSLSYYKITHESVARAAAHFSVLGLEENIVVFLYGSMTVSLREKARKKNKVRTRYILEAIEWLCANNCEWRNRGIVIEDVAQRLRNPTLVDYTRVIEGGVIAILRVLSHTRSFSLILPLMYIQVDKTKLMNLESLFRKQQKLGTE
jgi:hypothetical protein